MDHHLHVVDCGIVCEPGHGVGDNGPAGECAVLFGHVAAQALAAPAGYD